MAEVISEMGKWSISDVSMENGSWSFEQWHQVTCRTFSLTECASLRDRNFSGRIDLRKIGPLAISAISTNTPDKDLFLFRSNNEIRKDQRDDLMLYMVSCGSIGLVQEDRPVILKSGEMAIYDQTRPFKLHFSGRTEGKIITIPRQHLLCRLPDAAAAASRKISATTKLAMLTNSMVSKILECDHYSRTSIVSWLSASTIDIIAATLEAEFGDLDISALSDPRLQRAKSFLRDNLHDPEISLEVLSKAVGIAPRTLNRLFLAEGTTPIHWLWKQRLIESRKALETRQVVQVTEVALAHGFRDLSHFSRAFKKEFGTNPGAIAKKGASSGIGLNS